MTPHPTYTERGGGGTLTGARWSSARTAAAAALLIYTLFLSYVYLCVCAPVARACNRKILRRIGGRPLGGHYFLALLPSLPRSSYFSRNRAAKRVRNVWNLSKFSLPNEMTSIQFFMPRFEFLACSASTTFFFRVCMRVYRWEGKRLYARRRAFMKSARARFYVLARGE